MGTRILQILLHPLPKDHPHAYGDKDLLMIVRQAKKGSSPRVWGQVVRLLWFPTMHRIIPTRMGTSPLDGAPGQIAKDHPHAYGDKRNVMRLIPVI